MSPSFIVNSLMVVGLGAAAAYLYKNREAIKTAFNPASNKNIAYQSATEIFQAMTGNKIDSPGTAIANVFPSAAERAFNAMMNAPLPKVPIPAPYIGPPPGLPVGSGNAGQTALDTVAPFMYGLGDAGEARRILFKPRRNR